MTQNVLDLAAVRAQHTLLLLQLLWHEDLSRVDLSRRVGLSRSAISSIVAELIEAGLVLEGGQRAAGGAGRRATLLRLNAGAVRLLAADLGASHLRVALLDLRCRILHVLEEPCDILQGPQGGALDPAVERSEGVSRSNHAPLSTVRDIAGHFEHPARRKHMKHKVLMAALLGLGLLTACGTTAGGAGGGRFSLWGAVSMPGDAGKSSQSAQAGYSVQPARTKVAALPWITPGNREAAEVVPGEFIVRLRPGMAAQAATLSAAGLRLARVERGGLQDFSLYRAAGGLSAQRMTAQRMADTLAALRARPDVLSAEPNRVLHLFATPNDPLHPVQWDHDLMNLPAAWDRTTGKPVTVAVVDSGILPDHPDLKGKLLPGYDFVSDPDNAADGDGPDPDPTDPTDDSHYHGSHVAGTIGASANNGLGIAGASWGARILPLRALGTEGGSTMDIMRAVYWAAGGELDGMPKNPNPAQVINMSLGGKGACGDLQQQVFGELAQAGVIVVVAAGNSDDDANQYNPASCPNVITVGAVGPDGARAPYSNYGSRIDIMAPGGNTDLDVTIGDVTLPGGILSTVKTASGKLGYDVLQGTSMASPQIAGLVALLKGQEPNLTTAQVIARLKASAHPLGAGCDRPNGCGPGLVDAARLLSGTGGGGGGGGKPTPPPTKELSTYVFAFYTQDGDPDHIDVDRSQYREVSQDRLRKLFRIEGLTPGTYIALAWQDLNGNLDVDDGEPVGVYPQLLDLRGGDRGDVNIALKPFSAQSLRPASDSQRRAMQSLLQRH